MTALPVALNRGEHGESMDHWAQLMLGVVDASEGMGRAFDGIPKEDSRAASDATSLRADHKDLSENVEYGPFQRSSIYLQAAAHHVQAVAALYATGRVHVSLWPLIRAELELAGRIAWLLEPGDEESPVAPSVRLARYFLESFVDLNLHAHKEENLGARDRANTARSKTESVKAEAAKIDSNAELDWSGHRSRKQVSVLNERLPTETVMIDLFSRLAFTNAHTLYPFLSVFSHPSEVELRRQVESESGFFATGAPLLEWQARIAFMVFYKATHFVAGYLGLDTDTLEKWEERAPSDWFDTKATG